MKNDGWIGKKGFRYWYYRYRDSDYFSYVLIGITIVVCLVLLFGVIIPQLQNWFSIRQEVVATQQRIAVLQNNINFMNNLDRNALNAQLQTASSALPPQKDFGSMLDSLSSAAVSSGVSLNDFSFQVGDVASSSGLFSDTRYKNFASIKISLVAQGPIGNVKRFIANLESSVPLSEVVTIDGTGETASLTIQFYQKPFPNLVPNDDTPLTPLTAEKVLLLQKITAWKSTQPATSQTAPSGSNSALPLFD